MGSSFRRTSLTSVMVIEFELGFGFCCTKIGSEDLGVANLEPRHGGLGVRLRSDREISEYGISELVSQVEVTS